MRQNQKNTYQGLFPCVEHLVCVYLSVKVQITQTYLVLTARFHPLETLGEVNSLPCNKLISSLWKSFTASDCELPVHFLSFQGTAPPGTVVHLRAGTRRTWSRRVWTSGSCSSSSWASRSTPARPCAVREASNLQPSCKHDVNTAFHHVTEDV